MRGDGEHKTLVLEASELVRRFLLHVLPKGLMRVRHFRLLANRCRVHRLAHIREILAAPPPEPDPKSGETASTSRAGLVRCAGKGACARCVRSRRAGGHWAVRLITGALSPSG